MDYTSIPKLEYTPEQLVIDMSHVVFKLSDLVYSKAKSSNKITQYEIKNVIQSGINEYCLSYSL